MITKNLSDFGPEEIFGTPYENLSVSLYVILDFLHLECFLALDLSLHGVIRQEAEQLFLLLLVLLLLLLLYGFCSLFDQTVTLSFCSIFG